MPGLFFSSWKRGHHGGGFDLRYAQTRARHPADLGSVAFAADFFGKGVHCRTPPDVSAEAGKYKRDRKLRRARVRAVLPCT